MKYQTECEACGHIVTAYSHHLNKGLVGALRKLVDYYLRNKRFAVLSDLMLTINQYSNFQKLQYFKLIFRTPSGWFPTPLGIRFILGQVAIPDRARTFGKEILERDHPAWKNVEVTDRFVWEINQLAYKRADAYRAEKSKNPAQASLFPG